MVRKKTLQGGFTSEILSSYVFCPRKFMIHRRKSRKERIENEWEIVGGNTLKKKGQWKKHFPPHLFIFLMKCCDYIIEQMSLKYIIECYSL